MAFDPHKNFAVSTVATAPSPRDSGTSLVVAAGDGAIFPAASFNATVSPPNQTPTKSNSEIVRVTVVSTDTLTITRAQETTTAKAIDVGWIIAATITAKTLTDIETLSFNPYSFSANNTSAQNTGNAAFAQTTFGTEEWDTGNNFASNTFTAPVAGKYHFDGHVGLSGTTATILIVSLFKNGSEAKRGTDIRGISASAVAGNVSATMLLAVSDTVDVRSFGSAAIAIDTAAANCYFSGYLVSLT